MPRPRRWSASDPTAALAEVSEPEVAVSSSNLGSAHLAEDGGVSRRERDVSRHVADRRPAVDGVRTAAAARRAVAPPEGPRREQHGELILPGVQAVLSRSLVTGPGYDRTTAMTETPEGFRPGTTTSMTMSTSTSPTKSTSTTTSTTSTTANGAGARDRPAERVASRRSSAAAAVGRIVRVVGAIAVFGVSSPGCASHQQDAVATLGAATESARAGDLDRAADLAQRAIDEHAGFVDAHFLLAAIEERRGRFDAARDLYLRVLRLDPTSSHAAVALAQTYLAERRTDDARSWLLKAIEEDPGCEPAAFNLGSLAEADGSLDDAAAWFELSAALDLRDPRAPVRVARVRLAQGRTEDARRAADEAMRRAPDYPPAQAASAAARSGAK